MIFRQYIKLVFILNVLLSVGLTVARFPNRKRGISVKSIIDSVLPGVQPWFSSSLNRCEALKNILGITYDQILAKNASFHELIQFDHVTEDGNYKHNFTSTNKIKKLMANADNIIVFVHGFMESSEGLMVQAMATEFLKRRSVKLFALDGRKVITLEYFRSSTYARFMGELLGEFLSELIRGGQDPSKIHLIGHSLGAHISGIAGKQVIEATGKMIGRISGLDPAGPCFTTVGPESRLDKTDAAYVDVIHTNSGMLGLEDPVGHKDFYPNGGASQRMCFLYICDHSRSWEYFAESINAPKAFPARKCEDWTSFKEGKCGKRETARMGYHSMAGTPGDYFLSTASSSPFNLGAAGSG